MLHSWYLPFLWSNNFIYVLSISKAVLILKYIAVVSDLFQIIWRTFGVLQTRKIFSEGLRDLFRSCHGDTIDCDIKENTRSLNEESSFLMWLLKVKGVIYLFIVKLLKDLKMFFKFLIPGGRINPLVVALLKLGIKCYQVYPSVTLIDSVDLTA